MITFSPAVYMISSLVASWAGRTSFSVHAVSEFCHHYATFWEAIADRFPDRVAVRHGPRQVSWAGFEQRSARLAGAMHERGVARGDVIGDVPVQLSGVSRGVLRRTEDPGRPANINYRYTCDELLALVSNSEAKVLFFDAALRERVASIVDRAPELLLVEVGEFRRIAGPRRPRL